MVMVGTFGPMAALTKENFPMTLSINYHMKTRKRQTDISRWKRNKRSMEVWSVDSKIR